MHVLQKTLFNCETPQKLNKPVSAWMTTLIQSYSPPHTQQPEKQISINFLVPSWK